MPSILIVDDDQGQRTVLQTILKREGYTIETAENGVAALEKIEDNLFDVVVSDMRMAQMSGRELLHAIKSSDPDLPVLIVTAYAEVNDAVDLVAREGAFYYLEKPIQIDTLKKEIRRALEMRRGITDEDSSDEADVQEIHFDEIIGQSNSMRQLFKTMSRIIHRGANQVLITGNTGTGKGLVARAIHEYGRRKDKPFLQINCGAVHETLIESELFGHEKGAFTDAHRQKDGVFEAAKGGTVFLDEIGDLSAHTQSRLLHVLHEREIMRVGGCNGLKLMCVSLPRPIEICKPLSTRETSVKISFFRLNVIPLHMPDLRERSEDIGLLVDFFLQKFGGEYPGAEPKRMTPRAMSTLRRYDWPGMCVNLKITYTESLCCQKTRSLILKIFRLKFRIVHCHRETFP